MNDTNKINRLLCFSLLFFCANVFAQWSVLDNDKRLLLNKSESYLYQPFTAEQWNSSNFATEKEMKWFKDARYGMFIHFGLSSYVSKDLSWPIVYTRKAPDQGHGEYPESVWTKWPEKFKLEKFNADEWVKIAQEAGQKYIVVIAKHHDGFHMWDTKYSEFKITNTPFGRDYIKEIADACHKAKMPFGFYYSQRDWYHPDYAPVDPNTIKQISDPPYYQVLPGKKVAPGSSHSKYIDYQYKAIEELCTKYGKIDIFWFDAVYWGGMFTADMWDSENLTRMIRRLQPGIIINNRASIPGDFDTPEQRIGMYQKRPWESAMTLNGSWAYSPQPKIRSVKSLLQEMLSAASGNGNVLLSWGAHWNGEFDVAQKDTLLAVGKWLKNNGEAYYGTNGGPWMPSKNYGSVYSNKKIYIYVYNWDREKLSLPRISGNKLLSASLLNSNEKLIYGENGSFITFNKPKNPDKLVTVLVLNMANNISEVQENNGSSSVFDDPAYGEKFKVVKLKKTDWKDKNAIIDLHTDKKVTGLSISGNAGTLIISVSKDGKSWENEGTSSENLGEISISSFLAGVYIPGKEIRYIKLENQLKPNLDITIYSK